MKNGNIYRTVRRGRYETEITSDFVTWYWADDISKKWKEYIPEASVLIEDHYERFIDKHTNKNLSEVNDKKVYRK